MEEEEECPNTVPCLAFDCISVCIQIRLLALWIHTQLKLNWKNCQAGLIKPKVSHSIFLFRHPTIHWLHSVQSSYLCSWEVYHGSAEKWVQLSVVLSFGGLKMIGQLSVVSIKYNVQYFTSFPCFPAVARSCQYGAASLTDCSLLLPELHSAKCIGCICIHLRS